MSEELKEIFDKLLQKQLQLIKANQQRKAIQEQITQHEEEIKKLVAEGYIAKAAAYKR